MCLGLFQLRFAQVQISGFLTTLTALGQLLPLAQCNLGATFFLGQVTLCGFHRGLSPQQAGLVVAWIDAQQDISLGNEAADHEAWRRLDDSTLDFRENRSFLQWCNSTLRLYLNAQVLFNDAGNVNGDGRFLGIRGWANQVQGRADRSR